MTVLFDHVQFIQKLLNPDLFTLPFYRDFVYRDVDFLGFPDLPSNRAPAAQIRHDKGIREEDFIGWGVNGLNDDISRLDQDFAWYGISS